MAFESFREFWKTWILSLTLKHMIQSFGKQMFSVSQVMMLISAARLCWKFSDPWGRSSLGKCKKGCSYCPNATVSNQKSNLQICQAKTLSRATDRNWRRSCWRMKRLTASFSHWRPSNKMVDTSFLFVKGFGWWKDAESNRLGWWVFTSFDSKFTLSTGRISSGVHRKLDVDIPHIQGWLDMSYESGLYLGENFQLHSIDTGNFNQVFRTFRIHRPMTGNSKISRSWMSSLRLWNIGPVAEFCMKPRRVQKR